MKAVAPSSAGNGIECGVAGTVAPLAHVAQATGHRRVAHETSERGSHRTVVEVTCGHSFRTEVEPDAPGLQRGDETPVTNSSKVHDDTKLAFVDGGTTAHALQHSQHLSSPWPSRAMWPLLELKTSRAAPTSRRTPAAWSPRPPKPPLTNAAHGPCAFALEDTEVSRVPPLRRAAKRSLPFQDSSDSAATFNARLASVASASGALCVATRCDKSAASMRTDACSRRMIRASPQQQPCAPPLLEAEPNTGLAVCAPLVRRSMAGACGLRATSCAIAMSAIAPLCNGTKQSALSSSRATTPAFEIESPAPLLSAGMAPNALHTAWPQAPISSTIRAQAGFRASQDVAGTPGEEIQHAMYMQIWSAATSLAPCCTPSTHAKVRRR
eukprot:2908669-Prymnesium_polylepis.2